MIILNHLLLLLPIERMFTFLGRFQYEIVISFSSFSTLLPIIDKDQTCKDYIHIMIFFIKLTIKKNRRV